MKASANISDANDAPRKVEHRYSEIFHKLQKESYYIVPDVNLDKIHYSKLASPAKHNIYLLRDFKEPEMQTEFLSGLTDNQRYYRDHGYLIVRNLIPNELIDRYLALRERLSLGQDQFVDATPYIEHREIRDVACYKPLMDIIRELHSCEMGLIFTLTGFVSTQRGWHQDAYLDDEDALPRLAVWIACGSLTKDVGPFEYVPGSHRWMGLSNKKINEFLKPEYRWPNGHRARKAGVPGWGRISEAFVDPSVYAKIDRDNAEVHEFTAEKGDVLLWYGRLMHRGSPPRSDGATRPGLIGHYAPIFEKERGLFAKTTDGCRFIVPPGKIHTLKENR